MQIAAPKGLLPPGIHSLSVELSVPGGQREQGAAGEDDTDGEDTVPKLSKKQRVAVAKAKAKAAARPPPRPEAAPGRELLCGGLGLPFACQRWPGS